MLADVIRRGATRGLDFVTMEELRKRTGITLREVLKFALAEMLCNALDKEGATEVSIDVQMGGSSTGLRLATTAARNWL
ncbi:MAG: hypothetical protein V1850_01975 [Candidatus Bathyarchaeota archaeon]